MPINSIDTFRNRLPIVGQLRKGAAKPNAKRPGADLDYFRFTSDDEETERRFYERYGKTPGIDSSQPILAMLPYATLDENWQYWIEEWSASRLIWRGDGDRLHLKWDEQRGAYVRPENEMQPESSSAKPSGVLSLIVNSIGRVGVTQLLTTSIVDCAEITQVLATLYRKLRTLEGVPLWIYRRPRKFNYRDSKGEMRTTEKAMIQLELPDAYLERFRLHSEFWQLDAAAQIGSNAAQTHGLPYGASIEDELDATERAADLAAAALGERAMIEDGADLPDALGDVAYSQTQPDYTDGAFEDEQPESDIEQAIYQAGRCGSHAELAQLLWDRIERYSAFGPHKGAAAIMGVLTKLAIFRWPEQPDERQAIAQRVIEYGDARSDGASSGAAIESIYHGAYPDDLLWVAQANKPGAWQLARKSLAKISDRTLKLVGQHLGLSGWPAGDDAAKDRQQLIMLLWEINLKLLDGAKVGDALRDVAGIES